MENISNIMVDQKHQGLRKTLLAVLLGQLVSFLLALTSFCSSYLAKHGVDAPVTQTFFTYLCLTVVYGSIKLFRRTKMTVPWYYYASLGFVDVQGNYFFTKAFQFTSITSVTIFDCGTIPWVIVLTYFFLGTRYSIRQYFGVATCILGLALVLVSDTGVGGGGGSNPLFGDFLVVIATLFFSVSNVGEEYCVKQKDIVEVISMLAVFGLVFSICEIALSERQAFESIEWSYNVILGFAGYAAGGFLFYTLGPLLMKLSGATMFNLSALTSDMWAVLIRILFYNEEVSWLYYVSFAIVALGLVIYSISEKSCTAMTCPDEHLSDHYQVLAVECAESGRETLVA